MAPRGPKPQPAEVKKAKGNPGRRKIGADPANAEQSSKRGKVGAPAWLKKDGLDVWNRLAPRLSALKLLTISDAETFGRYCRNFARWLKMQTRLDDMGEIYEIETASGKVRRADPALIVSLHLERRLETAEANFGLNPAERQRIFAARAASPSVEVDLFGNPTSAQAGKKTKAIKPEPPRSGGGAIGLLN